jgi:hypothetical protein
MSVVGWELQQGVRTLPHSSAERNTSNDVDRVENRGKRRLERNAVATKRVLGQRTLGSLIQIIDANVRIFGRTLFFWSWAKKPEDLRLYLYPLEAE